MAKWKASNSKKCSVFWRVFYVHALLFVSLLYGATARSEPKAGGGGRCPFSRAAAAFTAPIHVVNSFLDGPSPSTHRATSMIYGGGYTTASFGASAIGKRSTSLGGVSLWDRDGSAPPPIMRPRRVSVMPLGMSAVQENPTAVNADEKAAQERARKAASTKPLEVHVIGLSHHNAAVEVREKLAVPEANWNEESARLCQSPNVVEAAVLSTCNRFEVYVAAHDAHAAIREAVVALQERSGLPQSILRGSLFMLSGEDAVWHVLRVSAGLDSLVVGEGQILSQVRQCYLHGTEEDGSAGKVVSRLLNTAVSAGKRVRAETSISRGAVSISSAAVEFSAMRAPADLKKPFGECTLAIVGAGKMSRLLVVHMASLGIKKIILVNRSMPRCDELRAEFPDVEMDVRVGGGEDDLAAAIAEADILYTSTSASGCIVTRPQLEKLAAGTAAGESGRPVMFVDISVPRNVESACNDVEGVFAYDVDDLKMVVARNTALRRREMLEAEGILAEEQDKFRGWQQSLTAIPAISKMQEKFESMRAEEVRKAANKLSSLSKKDLEVVEKLSKGIVNKMLHGPMSVLRAPEGPEEKRRTLKILKDMFKLESKI
ncbi:unnamed protein product [Phaeothamnion confervicola]